MSQRLSDILNRSTVSPNNDDKNLKQTPNKIQIVNLPSGEHNPTVSSDKKSKAVVNKDDDLRPMHRLGSWNGKWNLTGKSDVSDRETGPDNIIDPHSAGRTLKNVSKYLEDKTEKFLWKVAGNALSDIIPADSSSTAALSFINKSVSNNSWIGKNILGSSWFKGITADWLSSSASKQSGQGKIVAYRGDGNDIFETETSVGKIVQAPIDERLSSKISQWTVKDAVKARLRGLGNKLGSSSTVHGTEAQGTRAEKWAEIARQKLTSADIQNSISDNIQQVADELNIPVQIPDNKITYFGGNIQDATKRILAQDVIYGDVKSGYIGGGQYSTSSKASHEFWYKYGNRSDPYNDAKSDKSTYKDPEHISLNEVIANIRNNHLEYDYHTLNGFEMGSNHDWMIRLSPYVGPRGTCTPPLPCYMLPRHVRMTSAVNPKDKSAGFTIGDDNKSKMMQQSSRISRKVYADVATRIGADTQDLIDSDSTDNFFSFGHDCPCLTYNFNIGTIKTDQLKLWNGDTVDTFNGMNYHMTLNMSVLDDLFGSFSKYWMSYVNACYNPVNGTMAPYWASLFVIDLIIFRTGKQINWRFKLIGSPIEWSPSFSGEQSPNELRVDLTFGIVGLIQPDASDKFSGYNEQKFMGSTDNFHDPSWEGQGKGHFSLANLRKDDFGIQVNMVSRKDR